MSSSTLSVLSIELEAKQSKLDQDLDRAEEKAKRSGKKMEGSLSLSNAASGMVKIFAALGTVEAGFKSLTSVTQLFSGDIAGALDTLEQLPFGMGPAVAAGRDFFEVISGSRQEAERLSAEWAKVAGEIREAESLVDKLKTSQEDEDTSNVDAMNLQVNQINELNRRYTDFRNLLKDIPEADPIPSELVEKLKELTPEARNAGEAFEELGRKRKEALEVGIRATETGREAALKGIADIERQTRLERLQARGAGGDGDLQAKRLQAEISLENKLAAAKNDLERQALQEQFDQRMRLIDNEVAARRQAEEEIASLRERRVFQENRQRREAAERIAHAEAEAAAKRQKQEMERAERDRFVEGRGFEAAEFMRTSFEGGGIDKRQEVKDPDALGALNEGNAILNEIARNTKNTAATLT